MLGESIQKLMNTAKRTDFYLQKQHKLDYYYEVKPLFLSTLRASAYTNNQSYQISKIKNLGY